MREAWRLANWRSKVKWGREQVAADDVKKAVNEVLAKYKEPKRRQTPQQLLHPTQTCIERLRIAMDTASRQCEGDWGKYVRDINARLDLIDRVWRDWLEDECRARS
jgi:hypothetical protein